MNEPMTSTAPHRLRIHSMSNATRAGENANVSGYALERGSLYVLVLVEHVVCTFTPVGRTVLIFLFETLSITFSACACAIFAFIAPKIVRHLVTPELFFPTRFLVNHLFADAAAHCS